VSKPSKNELKKKLTPLQFHVTQENGTEAPFENAYYNNKKPGIYVDIVSGEVLFTTNEQYDAHCGWPAFTKPIKPLDERFDTTHGMRRTEVRSPEGASHLGHVFADGPTTAGGLRYCINSAALRFIPVEELKDEGYESYLKYFDKRS